MISKKRYFPLIIVVIIFAFFMFNRSNTVNNNIADVEELSNVSTNLQDSEDILLLDSSKIYEKDDSKNIPIELNPEGVVNITKEDLYIIQDLFKNTKLTLTTENETLNLVKTKNKSIYTRVKFQTLPSKSGGSRGLFLGPASILDDGTFYQIFVKDGDFIYAKGKFTESEMKVIEDIYQRAIEKKS
ncbi:hypothetical protein [Paraclostridium bifermentans]|uniref:hypothetical protein n=2 Tax=Paraclostridium bifermentans TaxID=1490 RepID=UPI001476EF33|nr:hypothetical protein [Paraclostridium bifermentans]TQO56295.1 hypothetical protein D5S05_13905 [Paraclostridium bifermentans]GKZ02953.1 hypothetical protein ANS014_13870 [Paraclostridium bifermentans]GKZ07008.1 hypothetical protein ANS015_18910 [Paraclostridium bifermentans]GKZ11874.1 hypothetical protein ANS017_32580 [Paraclostridium bifermentans]